VTVPRHDYRQKDAPTNTIAAGAGQTKNVSDLAVPPFAWTARCNLLRKRVKTRRKFQVTVPGGPACREDMGSGRLKAAYPDSPQERRASMPMRMAAPSRRPSKKHLVCRLKVFTWSSPDSHAAWGSIWSPGCKRGWKAS